MPSTLVTFVTPCGGAWASAAKVNAESARQRATEAAREADRAEAYALVSSNGRLWRASAAVPDHRAMSERWVRLARSEVSPLRNESQYSSWTRSQTARYAYLEIGVCFQVPVVRNEALQASCAYDQAYRRAGNYAV